ncbi:MAG TPA: hypothetical protein VIO39_01940 [Methylotenera sp.]
MTEEFDWFHPEDIPFLIDALNKTNGNPVLVGGQSLTFWIDYYSIPIPHITTPYLTQDADILGSVGDAQVVANLLGGKVKIADISDNTPNTAIVIYNAQDGRKLLIDFMGGLVGLDNDEINKTAVTLKYKDIGVINILHPRLVLKSRIANLEVLPSKRNGNGVSQARLAVEVCKKFITEYVKSLPTADQENYLMTKARWLAKLAKSPSGLFVYKNWGIDVLEAAPISLISHEAFLKLDWPKQLGWVANKRKPKKLQITKNISRLNHP